MSDGLSDDDRFRLLSLERERAQSMQGQQAQAPEQSLPDAAKASLQQIAAPFQKAGQALQPKNLTGVLPVAGMLAGNAILPGAGGAAGAGLGSIAQKIANMAYGTSGPVEPTTSVAGIPMNPKAAIDPMINAATAGAPETTEGQSIANKISSLYQGAKPGFKKALSQVVQASTGKSAAKVRGIIEDPTAVLPEGMGGAKSVKDASDAYGQALDNTTVEHPGKQYVTRGLEKKDFGPFKKGHQEAEEYAQTIYDKWKSGETINAQDAYNAKRATDKIWPAVVKERNAEDIRQMSEFKTAMDDVLSDQAGHFAAASKDYARARRGSDFTQILPRTKTGDISTVKSFLLPMVEPKKLPFMLASSPAAFGAGNLAAQGAMKGLNVIGKDPNSRQVLLGLLQQIMQNRNAGQQ